MASLKNLIPGGFDATAVAPDAGPSNEPVPAGIYEAEITGSDVKDAKTGNGSYLALEFTILGPTHARRKVWKNITLTNTNAQAEQIGHGQLSALCHAVNIPKLDDSDQLFQKLLRLRVGIEPAKGQYPAKNDITGFEAHGNTPAPQANGARPAANTPAPTPAAAKKAPWQK
jgi:hypothetical protein